ncbi:sugar-binding transcriptional regulator [Streptococcus phocae subsp. phocae]
MKEDRRRLLAKIAYLHYIEGKSQTTIANELDIYRTTVCRMLATAREQGLVRIEIAVADSHLFALEERVKNRYGLSKIDLVSHPADASPGEIREALATTAAAILRSRVKEGDKIGLSWGATLSAIVDKLDAKVVKDSLICPLAGGPSHLNAKYHVNTLVYRLARVFHSQGAFINATVLQNDATEAQSILTSKPFESISACWQELDMALIGIGGEPAQTADSQWRDLLSSEDISQLQVEGAVGEICCRFFDQTGNPVHHSLQNRTIAISLDQLSRVPETIAVAAGKSKAKAILAALKAGFISHLITDEATIEAVLALDAD